MAGWLEALEGAATSVFDVAGQAGAEKLRSEIVGEEKPPVTDQPEKQYDTTTVKPVDGPGSKEPVKGAQEAFADIWGKYKWLVIGGLALGGYMAIKGAR